MRGDMFSGGIKMARQKFDLNYHLNVETYDLNGRYSDYPYKYRLSDFKIDYSGYEIITNE